MRTKLTTPLTAKDKADRKEFRRLLPLNDRDAMEALVNNMSKRLKPEVFKWTGNNLPDKRILTEDLKTDYTAVIGPSLYNRKPGKKGRKPSVKKKTTAVRKEPVTGYEITTLPKNIKFEDALKIVLEHLKK